MVDIEVDHPFEIGEKIARWEVQQLRLEVLRLKKKCGEEITMGDLLNGFVKPTGGFNIKRSARWPA